MWIVSGPRLRGKDAVMNTIKRHPSFIVTERLRNRFDAKTIGADSGCRIWTGAISKSTGYGAFKIGRSKIDAHVAAWRIAHGGDPVPVGKLIMHKCNCRTCVNPDHLQLGTTSENMLMAYAGDRADDFKCRGEDHPDAVLTEDLVRKIRELHIPKRVGATKIARLLGLNKHCVGSVLKGRTWKHVKTDVEQ